MELFCEKHFIHEAKWIVSRICVACFIEILDLSSTSQLKKKQIFSELLKLLCVKKNELKVLFSEEIKITAHFLNFQIDILSNRQNETNLREKALKCCSRLLDLVEREDMRVGVFDYLICKIKQNSNFESYEPSQLREMDSIDNGDSDLCSLIYFFSSFISSHPHVFYILPSYPFVFDLLFKMLLSTNEDKINCSACTWISILKIHSSSIFSIFHFPSSSSDNSILSLPIVQKVCLSILVSMETNNLSEELIIKLLDLFLECLEAQPSVVECFEKVGKTEGQTDVMMILKKRLLSSNNRVVFSSLQLIRSALKQSFQLLNLFTPQSIPHPMFSELSGKVFQIDLIDLLFEKLSCLDPVLLSLCLDCLYLLTNNQQFFSNCYDVYGFESLLRLIERLMGCFQNSESDMETKSKTNTNDGLNLEPTLINLYRSMSLLVVFLREHHKETIKLITTKHAFLSCLNIISTLLSSAFFLSFSFSSSSLFSLFFSSLFFFPPPSSSSSSLFLLLASQLFELLFRKDHLIQPLPLSSIACVFRVFCQTIIHYAKKSHDAVFINILIHAWKLCETIIEDELMAMATFDNIGDGEREDEEIEDFENDFDRKKKMNSDFVLVDTTAEIKSADDFLSFLEDNLFSDVIPHFILKKENLFSKMNTEYNGKSNFNNICENINDEAILINLNSLLTILCSYYKLRNKLFETFEKNNIFKIENIPGNKNIYCYQQVIYNFSVKLLKLDFVEFLFFIKSQLKSTNKTKFVIDNLISNIIINITSFLNQNNGKWCNFFSVDPRYIRNENQEKNIKSYNNFGVSEEVIELISKGISLLEGSYNDLFADYFNSINHIDFKENQSKNNYNYNFEFINLDFYENINKNDSNNINVLAEDKKFGDTEVCRDERKKEEMEESLAKSSFLLLLFACHHMNDSNHFKSQFQLFHDSSRKFLHSFLFIFSSYSTSLLCFSLSKFVLNSFLSLLFSTPLLSSISFDQAYEKYFINLLTLASSTFQPVKSLSILDDLSCWSCFWTPFLIWTSHHHIMLEFLYKHLLPVMLMEKNYIDNIFMITAAHPTLCQILLTILLDSKDQTVSINVIKVFKFVFKQQNTLSESLAHQKQVINDQKLTTQTDEHFDQSQPLFSQTLFLNMSKQQEKEREEVPNKELENLKELGNNIFLHASKIISLLFNFNPNSSGNYRNLTFFLDLLSLVLSFKSKIHYQENINIVRKTNTNKIIVDNSESFFLSLNELKIISIVIDLLKTGDLDKISIEKMCLHSSCISFLCSALIYSSTCHDHQAYDLISTQRVLVRFLNHFNTTSNYQNPTNLNYCLDSNYHHYSSYNHDNLTIDNIKSKINKSTSLIDISEFGKYLNKIKILSLFLLNIISSLKFKFKKSINNEYFIDFNNIDLINFQNFNNLVSKLENILKLLIWSSYFRQFAMKSNDQSEVTSKSNTSNNFIKIINCQNINKMNSICSNFLSSSSDIPDNMIKKSFILALNNMVLEDEMLRCSSGHLIQFIYKFVYSNKTKLMNWTFGGWVEELLSLIQDHLLSNHSLPLSYIQLLTILIKYEDKKMENLSKMVCEMMIREEINISTPIFSFLKLILNKNVLKNHKQLRDQVKDKMKSLNVTNKQDKFCDSFHDVTSIYLEIFYLLEDLNY